jgi:hypothetical protein
MGKDKEHIVIDKMSENLFKNFFIFKWDEDEFQYGFGVTYQGYVSAFFGGKEKELYTYDSTNHFLDKDSGWYTELYELVSSVLGNDVKLNHKVIDSLRWKVRRRLDEMNSTPQTFYQ